MSDDAAGATVMIVDDEPNNLNVLSRMLRQEAFTVRAFRRGDHALEAARAEPPELVLLDVRMPLMDGYEVCRRLKADEQLRGIPVIFLSASTEPEDKVAAFQAGGVDYVTKPFAAIEVIARVRTHLGVRRYQLHLEGLVRERMQEVAEAHRRLRVWDEAKAQWISTLAHELRTPMNGVFAISELLFLDLPDGSAYQGLRDDYELSRRRVEKLIDDALTLAQIDVAAERFDVAPLQIAALLRGAVEAASSPDQRFDVQAELAEFAHATVLATGDLLGRALEDLLVTAACCARPGAPVRVEGLASNRQVTISMAAPGEPLDAAAIEALFDVGGQRAAVRGGGDVGLAPALASRIVRLFEGRVTARAERGCSVVIDVALPIVRGAEA